MNFYSLFKQLTLAFFLMTVITGRSEAMTLEDQPDETIVHIATFVPPEDVLHSLVRVNKKFHRLMNDQQLWRQYYSQKTGIGEIPQGPSDDSKDWKKLCISLIKNEQKKKMMALVAIRIFMNPELALRQMVLPAISSIVRGLFNLDKAAPTSMSPQETTEGEDRGLPPLETDTPEEEESWARNPSRSFLANILEKVLTNPKSIPEAIEEREADDLPPLEPSPPEQEEIHEMSPLRLLLLSKLANGKEDSLISSQEKLTQLNLEDDDLPLQQSSTNPIQTFYSYLPSMEDWKEAIANWLTFLTLFSFYEAFFENS